MREREKNEKETDRQKSRENTNMSSYIWRSREKSLSREKCVTD
jgi:hypothetical protein